MKRSGVFWSSATIAAMRIFASGCAFALFWVIARMSVVDAGAFRTIFVFFLSLEFLSLLGMNQYLIREVSVASGGVRSLLVSSFVFSLGVCLMLALGLWGVAGYGSFSPVVSSGLLLLVVSLPATAAVCCGQSILVGLGRGVEFGLLQGVEVVCRTGTGIVLMLCGADVLAVVTGFVVIRYLVVALYWWRVVPELEQGAFSFNADYFRDFLKKVPPFAGILILYLVSRFAAQVMLPWMYGDKAAGHFAVAYQMLDLLLLVPTALSINLMPLFAQRVKESEDEYVQVCGLGLKIMTLAVLPATVMLSCLAGPVVMLLFGPDFTPSILLLQVLIWAGFLLALDQVLSTAAIARGRQDADLKALLAGASASLLLLYPLISVYGALGAVAGVLGGCVVLMGARLFLSRDVIPGLHVLSRLWRILVAGGVMWLSMAFVPHPVLAGFVGVAAYGVALFVFQGVDRVERAALKTLMAAKVQRSRPV
ncbi:MAG: oligosaccharide flippase family protein [Desulfovibrionaceae bacterium]